MSSFAERIAGLSPKRQELLARLLEKEQLDFSKIVAGPRKRGLSQVPMSFAQERLWFLDQLEPNRPIYNIPDTHYFKGPFDHEALERSLSEMSRRHEVLRTTFQIVDGNPVQVIGEPQPLTLQVVDLSALPEKERAEEAQRLANEESQKPFDLSRGPLFRVRLARLAEEDHLLLSTIHHIIADGWSLGVLGRELSALYEAYKSGQDSPLPEPAIQYADFSIWQREWLQGEVLEKQLDYWREQLGGELPEFELPGDRARPARQSYRGAAENIELSPEVTQRLKEIAREGGATLFMALLAAFNLLLSRYSGQDDLLVGTPIANRNRAETENLIGFFVNTLVLRTKIRGELTFRELLDQVRETTLGASEHQDVPFEKLVEELQPERNLSRQPLFQVMFSLADWESLQLKDLELSWTQTEVRTVKFDMTLSMLTDDDYLGGAFTYNVDLFDATTIKRIVRQFELLVESIADDPDQRISDLPMLTESEREMLTAWNETKREYPQSCVHELFEQQVARTPAAVALTFNEERVTYDELNRRANQLAHHLRGRGVGPEVLVGISLERSVDLVVAILGVLKAGGAFVPLDPSYPRERLDYMIADAGICVTIDQNTDWSDVGRCLEANLLTEITADNLAYVIYTSGSTGRPKGVLIQQRGVANLAFAQRDAFEVSAPSRVLQFASVSFDAAVSEIFVTLLTGATLCLAPSESLLPVDPLLNLLRAQEITTVTLPPSVWALLPSDDLPALQTAISAGEACSAQMAAAWGRDGRRFINAYGPTEVTVCATISGPLDGSGRPSIGPPIANAQVHVLDRHLRPVPVGVVGELFVGGIGLARGYLQRADLTAERFVPDPFSVEPGRRLYRTGDLGRYRADGSLEYVGRLDQQVKVRGYRIELGEIESALVQHPAIRDAVVVAREDTAGDKRLVAYLIRESDGEDVSQLRAWLLQKLPEYMAPAAFVSLTEFPLTPNGKIDRRALPAPDASRPAQTQAYVAPRDRLEQFLVDLWQATLSLKQIGVNDNFFDSGGNSLKGAVLINRLQQSLGEYVYVVAIFDAPTVAELAKYLRRHYPEAVTRICGAEAATPDAKHRTLSGSRPELRPISRVETGRDTGLPLSFAQQRLWVIDQLEPGSSAYNIPLGEQITGPLNVRALEQSFNELVRRHESLRTTFDISDGQPVQLIREAQPLTLEVVDLTNLPADERESEAERLAHEEAQQPFDLVHGPLLRVRLLKLEETEYLLLLTMHHIISDGWSMEVMVRELTTLYDAFIADQSSPLPELPLQYVDFALWQREWLQGEVLEQQLAYWKQQLGDALPVLSLPTDRPRPPVRTTRTAHEAVVIGDDVRAGLKQIGQQEGATMFMTFLAAFNVLLARLSGQHDILVGTPIAGRSRAELENLIGFFVNTLVLRTDLSGDPSFREMVQRVRAVSLGAYKHQDFPFEKLVDELKPDRDPSLTPLFQVMFMFENQAEGEIKLSGLQFTPARAENEAGKFDLTLGMVETRDELVAVLRYNTDLFNATTVQRFVACFETLLRGIAQRPDQRISQFGLLSEAERARVLEEWNQTAKAVPARCAHELFEDQVERRPEATALVFGEEQLTYRELNARANRLARYLRTRGVGPEVPVGICLDRGVEMIVAVLGVLKAGGAFVPMDPGYPRERLDYMIDDSGISITIDRNTDWTEVEGFGGGDVNVDMGIDNVAYAIYTSGSTGRPKGVMLCHRGLTNLALAQAGVFQVSEGSRVLQFASFSFDATISEIFKTFLSGATLVIASAESLMPVTPLLNLLREQRITTATLPPSVLAVMPTEDLPDLRTVVSAGEACSAEIAGNWSRGGRRFLNAYGPTETTVCATCSEPLDGSYKPPIGWPISNTEAYVLDSNLEPVPAGVVGELYVGGAGVARAYLGRSELTAERFVPHPFSKKPGRRLYRTGDLACFREDGQLDYRGRIDQQVKVRGFRIELEEIEAVLGQHPDVRAALVLAREDTPGDKRLVAYVVADGEHEASEWRRWLSEKLPDYMLPSAFISMEAFPLTRNGKVDRAALPAPDGSRPAQEQEYVAPRDRLEQVLVDLWQPLLGLQQLGVHDNFFEAGGDSIKGAILINKLQQVLGEYVYVVAIFDAPTVAQLADYLRRHYPTAVQKLCDVDVVTVDKRERRITREQIVEFHQLIPPLPPFPPAREKNPRAVFVLSPPRSGSTLLRVMLGGHPQLFAPPELELLSFNTLADRKAEFGERFAFWLEGTVRAVMQLRHCSAEEAKQIMADCEAQQFTAKQFYALLQSWLGERVLVDKTPSYALDLEILQRAERDFTETRYVHLLRHPYAMIRSFEAARLEQVFFRHEHNLDRRELAELIWLVSQQNILQFLETVPAERQHQVHFEQLVTEPERVLRVMCEFLQLDYVDAMAAPYQQQEQRMVDGIHPLSKMLGDVKFHEHKSVEAATADRWRQQLADGDRLGDETWAIAERLGYLRLDVEREREWSPLVELQRGDQQQPLFFVHPVGGNVFCYAELARQLGGEQSFYGLQSFGLAEGQSPLTDITEMSARYLEALRRVQPEGPYRLGGWSIGGLIAFEIAQQLHRAGEEVELLALLDSYTPATSGQPAQVDDEQLMRQFKSDNSAFLFEIFRANVHAMMRYKPERYPGRITYFRAGTRLADNPCDPIDDWRHLAADGVEVHLVPGNHYTMLKEPAVAVLADWLKVCLNINRGHTKAQKAHSVP